jgi:hypothetical protein
MDILLVSLLCSLNFPACALTTPHLTREVCFLTREDSFFLTREDSFFLTREDCLYLTREAFYLTREDFLPHKRGLRLYWKA